MYADPRHVGTPGDREFARRRRAGRLTEVLDLPLRGGRRTDPVPVIAAAAAAEEEEGAALDDADLARRLRGWARQPLRPAEVWHCPRREPPPSSGPYWTHCGDPAAKRPAYYDAARDRWQPIAAHGDLATPTAWASDVTSADGVPLGTRPGAWTPPSRPVTTQVLLRRLVAAGIGKSLSSLRNYFRRGMPATDLAAATAWIARHVGGGAASAGRPADHGPGTLYGLAAALGISYRAAHTRVAAGCPRDPAQARLWQAARRAGRPHSLAAIAAALGVSVATVHAWVREGCPRDPAQARAWAREHRKRAIS